MNERSDEDLVIRCLLGDRECFDTLVRRYRPPIFGFVLQRAPSRNETDDLVQEVFLEAYRSLERCREPALFARWLFGIARNRCEKWRRRKRMPLMNPEMTANVEERAAPADDWEEEMRRQKKISQTLAATLDGLPPDLRRILDMKHRLGKTCEEIARALNCPAGTVKSHLARTYKTLRQRLSPMIDKGE